MKNYIVLILSGIVSFAKGQSKSMDSLQLYRKWRIDSIQSLVKIKTGDNIADIGSGKGDNIIKILNGFPFGSYYLEDIDSSRCNKYSFQNRLNLLKSNIPIDSFHFIHGTDTTTKLPHRFFDWVFMTAVTHEFTKPNEMLQNISTILKPDGYIIIEEPLVYKKAPKDHGCNNPYFLEIEFKELLRLNNWTILQEKQEQMKNKNSNQYRKVFLCRTQNTLK